MEEEVIAAAALGGDCTAICHAQSSGHQWRFDSATGDGHHRRCSFNGRRQPGTIARASEDARNCKEDDRAGFPHNAKTGAEAAMTFHNDRSFFP